MDIAIKYERETKAKENAKKKKKSTKKAGSFWASEKIKQLKKGAGRFSYNIIFNANSYYGMLSNFGSVDAGFTLDGTTYDSVEQAFQVAKLDYSNMTKVQKTNIKRAMMKTKNGSELKKLGAKITGFDAKKWNAQSDKLMYELLTAKFKQNPTLAYKLIGTGKNNLTHTGKYISGKWETKFPEILMQVRDDLQKGMTEKDIRNYATEAIGLFGNESAKHNVKKEAVKTEQATQFIGHGAVGSSTDNYADVYKAVGKANTGTYTEDDVVFVASNGRRKNTVFPINNKDGKPNGPYNNLILAMNAGATIIIDVKEHREKFRSKKNEAGKWEKTDEQYNIGEMAIAEFLENNGYQEQVTKGKPNGVFKKNDSVFTEMEVPTIDKAQEVLSTQETESETETEENPFEEDNAEDRLAHLQQLAKENSHLVTKQQMGIINVLKDPKKIEQYIKSLEDAIEEFGGEEELVDPKKAEDEAAETYEEPVTDDDLDTFEHTTDTNDMVQALNFAVKFGAKIEEIVIDAKDLDAIRKGKDLTQAKLNKYTKAARDWTAKRAEDNGGNLFSLENQDNTNDVKEDAFTVGLFDMKQEILYQLEDEGHLELNEDGEITEINNKEDASYMNTIIKYMEKLETIYEDFGINPEITIERYLTKGRTRGKANVDTNTIHLRYNENGDSIFTRAEILMHEMIHIATEHALRLNPGLRAKIRVVQKATQKELTKDGKKGHEIFLPNPTGVNTTEDIEVAERIYKYAILGDEAEFMAYSMTHKPLMKVLETFEVISDGLDALTPQQVNENRRNGTKLKGFDKLVNMMKHIFNVVTTMLTLSAKDVENPKDANKASAMMEQFTFDIAKLQAKMAKNTLEETDVTKVGAMWNIIKKAHIKTDQLSDKFNGKIEKFGSKLSEKTGRNTLLKRVTELNGIRQVKETGFIQAVWHELVHSTSDELYAGFYDLFNQTKKVQEADKEKFRHAIEKNLSEELLKDATEQELKALKRTFLDTDVGTLLRNGYTIEQVLEFINKPEILTTEIDSQRKAFGRTATANEYMAQAQGLGYYMAHSVSIVPNLMLNANNIYNGLFKSGASYIKPPADEVKAVKMIDNLASLYALKYIGLDTKEIAHGFANTRQEDIVGTMEIFNGYMKSYNEQLGRDSKVGSSKMDVTVKGYTHDKFEVSHQSMIVKESDVKDFELRGYSFMGGTKDLADVSYLSVSKDAEKKYRMVGKDYDPKFHKGLIDTIGLYNRGTTLGDIIRTDGNSLIKVQDVLDHIVNNNNSQRASGKEININTAEDKLIPLLNQDGAIVDYKDEISHKEKIDFMSLDDSIITSVSNTLTNTHAKTNAIIGNKKAIRWIMNDAAKNYTTHPEDFVVIEPSRIGFKSPTDKQWAIIPEYTRNYIYQTTKSNKLIVRKDLLDNIVGYRAVSINEMKKLKKKAPRIHRAIQVFEKFWFDFVSKFKGIIVIVTGDVVVANFVSNMMVAVQHGIDPWTYTKDTIEGWKMLNQQQKDSDAMLALQIQKKAGMKISEAQIKALQKKIDNNPINELVEAGLYSPIVEDINTGVLREGNSVDVLLDKASKKMPTAVKNVIESVYVTEGGKYSLYGKMMKFVQYGDITARYAIMKKLKKKRSELKDVASNIDVFFSPGVSSAEIEAAQSDNKRDNMTDKEMLAYVDQLFVNYSYNEHRYMRLLNDTGFMMFTKYFFRTPKAIIKMMTRSPGVTSAFQGAQWAIGVDVVDPLDTFINPFDALFNRIGNPIDMFGTVVTPHIDDIIPKFSSFINFDW